MTKLCVCFIKYNTNFARKCWLKSCLILSGIISFPFTLHFSTKIPQLENDLRQNFLTCISLLTFHYEQYSLRIGNHRSIEEIKYFCSRSHNISERRWNSLVGDEPCSPQPFFFFPMRHIKLKPNYSLLTPPLQRCSPLPLFTGKGGEREQNKGCKLFQKSLAMTLKESIHRIQ